MGEQISFLFFPFHTSLFLTSCIYTTDSPHFIFGIGETKVYTSTHKQSDQPIHTIVHATHSLITVVSYFS